jgi:thiamine biosynthesis lipoprotein
LGFKNIRIHSYSFFLIFFILTACTQTESFRVEFALGTVCSVNLYDQQKDKIFNDIFTRIHEIENLMSVNISSSDISHINASAGIKPVQVHKDVFKVIEHAVYYAQVSDGAFDPTIGPLFSLWGINSDNPRVPSQMEIEKTLSLVNWQDIELDHSAFSVFLKHSGMALDLGAIAKGYAADEAVLIIHKAGIKQAVIDLGGDVIVYGKKADNSPWRVGIQNPNEAKGITLGVLNIQPQDSYASIVTSGVYERFFEYEGSKYHHIFSPTHGYPADSGLLSVTVIAHNAMNADALSTAVFVMGYERGRNLIDSIHGTEAVFFFCYMSVRKTSGIDLLLTDSYFRLV